MKPFNWRHAVALFFWKSVSPPELDCVLSVYRTAEQGDFSDKEIAETGGAASGYRARPIARDQAGRPAGRAPELTAFCARSACAGYDAELAT